ncbi:MAG: hypothetical protein ACRDON_12115 [Gaiellaceae bacterium]
MEALWLLALLLCPAVMGAVMYLMMRRTRGGDRRADSEEGPGG